MFRTPDIALAIALMFSGVELKELERLQKDRFVFCFSEDERTQELVALFWKQEISPPVQKTLALSRKIKGMIRYAEEEK